MNAVRIVIFKAMSKRRTHADTDRTSSFEIESVYEYVTAACQQHEYEEDYYENRVEHEDHEAVSN